MAVPSGFNLRLVAKCQMYCKTYILIRSWYLEGSINQFKTWGDVAAQGPRWAFVSQLRAPGSLKAQGQHLRGVRGGLVAGAETVRFPMV